MISVFNSKNPASFVIAKSFLQDNKIPFIPKGDNIAGLEYTEFEILVREEDFEKAKELLSDIEENNGQLLEKFDKKHQPVIGYFIIAGILISVVLLFMLGLWIRE